MHSIPKPSRSFYNHVRYHRLLSHMFTPPSSPPPPRKEGEPPLRFDVDHDEDPEPFFSPPHDRKRALGRRTTCAVILIPVFLILITAMTRFCTHPAILDILTDPAQIPVDWTTWRTTAADWRPHKRHPADEDSPPPLDGRTPQRPPTGVSPAPSPTSLLPTSLAFPTQPVPSSSSTRPSTTTTTSAAQQLPTVPVGPIEVPTPFPVPFDTSLQQNFSSVSCYNFFLNMTNSIAFRSCRPFSLLLQRSNAFIEVFVLRS